MLKLFSFGTSALSIFILHVTSNFGPNARHSVSVRLGRIAGPARPHGSFSFAPVPQRAGRRRLAAAAHARKPARQYAAGNIDFHGGGLMNFAGARQTVPRAVQKAAEVAAARISCRSCSPVGTGQVQHGFAGDATSRPLSQRRPRLFSSTTI